MVDGSLHNGRSIAGSSGLNPRYVRRVLQCAFLAPNIVEAILDGQQPHNLTVGKLGVICLWIGVSSAGDSGFSSTGLSLKEPPEVKGTEKSHSLIRHGKSLIRP